jgi:hypothetical protein
MPTQTRSSDPNTTGAVHTVALAHMRRRRARLAALASAFLALLAALASLLAWLFHPARR